MKIVYVTYDDFNGAGVIHAYQFACEMAGMGHDVLFLMLGDPETIGLMERRPPFEVDPILFEGPLLATGLRRKVAAFRPDIIHAWTPRSIPARAALELKLRTGARLIVHYEDDEDSIYRHEFPGSPSLRLRYALKILTQPVYDPDEPLSNLWYWKHPLISWLANNLANRFTALSPALRDMLVRKWGKGTHLIYPGVDLGRFRPGAAPLPVSERFGIRGGKLIIYSGAIGRIHDFDILLNAMTLLVKAGERVCLLQLGRQEWRGTGVESLIASLGLRDNVILGGAVPHKDIPGYLAAADILVHPSRDNSFNRYRLPSKIPEYLAMGKPTVLSHTGIGEMFQDRSEVLKTYSDDPSELAERIRELLADGSLRALLGANARACAERMFNLKRNAALLRDIYEDSARACWNRG
ncbi:MAG: glycosyltransferase family 4 protein [bacterium]|nr:glycosyltransferase family 4 protein [bacterium]